MIKRIKAFIQKHVHSLKSGMFAVITVAIVVAIGMYVAVHSLFVNWIDTKYNSESEKNERYDNYIANLQTFIDRNGVLSTDTSEITKWMNNNRNVYLFLYKDGQLFFDGSLDDTDTPSKDEGGTQAPDSEEDGASGGDYGGATDEEQGSDEGDAEGGETPPEGDGGNTESPGEGEGGTDAVPDAGDNAKPDGTEGDGGASDNGDNNTENPGNSTSQDKTDTPSGGTSQDKTDKDEEDDSNKGSGTIRPGPGGITIDYPTRDEIIASAEKNGLLPVEFSDGTLFVSLVDFTDYFYYDIANIVSLVAGFIALALILMFYFHHITSKITRLAQDVSAVYEVDMSHTIRTDDGTDELSALTKNVEQMRISMLSSLEKEKEALNANAELITSMSHDIRTPLTVLLGYLDIMKTMNADEKIEDYIQASEATALRLKELSDDMFRYFLVFGGSEIEVNVEAYDAKTLFEQMFSEHILLLREKGYTVNVQMGSAVKDGLQVLTDAPKVMRVIDNLFSNIYKYADKEKRITVAVGVARGKLNIAIKNYVLEDQSKAESNGVGLKTCKKICESLGMNFDYGITGIKNMKIFTARLEFNIVKKDAEA